MSALAIECERLGKVYRLDKRTAENPKSRLALLPFRSRGQEDYWALRDCSFSVKSGERIGLIGRNGAGKSTLLKILARIVDPTVGTATIRGRLSALIEVGTGFHGDLSGRENVYLYGSILGMRRREVAAKFDAIVGFSGVEKFIDSPVKHYSSGMKTRLAFAVSAHLDPDVLLLDEVLAVGDLAFQRKCLEFAASLERRGATIVLVSHDSHSIRSLCERVVYLSGGTVRFDGLTEEGLRLYERDLDDQASRRDSPVSEFGLSLKEICTLDVEGLPRANFKFDESMRIRIDMHSAAPIAQPSIIVAVVRGDGVACCNFSNELDGFEIPMLSGDIRLEVQVPPLKLISDDYSLHLLIRRNGFGEILGSFHGPRFTVSDRFLNHHFGIFHERATWSNRSP